MNYDKYIELYKKSLVIDVKSILSESFYSEVIEATQNKYINKVRTEFEKIMYEIIEKDKDKDNSEKFDVIDLRKKLIRQYFWIESTDNILIYKVYNLLTNRFNCGKEYSKNEEDWVKSISLALFYFNNNFEKYPELAEHLKTSYTEIANSVDSCKFFRKRGFNICVRKGEIQFNNVDSIFTQLHSKAEKLGCAIYVFFTINLIKDIKSCETGLYKFPTFVGITENTRLVPLGLAYQLGLKYLNRPPMYSTSGELNKAYKEFLEFSKYYASLFELQTYGDDFEMILMSSDEKLLDKIISILYSDNLFKVEQYIPNDVIDFVEFLANKALDRAVDKSQILKFLTLTNFYKSLVKIKSDYFTIKDLANNLDEDFLKKFTFNSINQSFKKHNDFDKLDFNTKIFFKFNEKYMILLPQFACIGLYRILYNLLDDLKISNQLSTEIGTWIEEYLEAKMEEKNFGAISSRKYKVHKPQRDVLNINSQELESDFTLQSKEYIAFIEVKKKELTQIAKRGNIVFLLNDLANSLLDSHKQANRHMRYISEFKSIKFYKINQKPEVMINLDGRDIIKISVSSLDYLSLHSKDVAQKFIRMLYNKVVSLKENGTDAENKALEKFNNSNFELSKELNQKHSDFQLIEQNRFYNSFFLNIFHLTFLINQSKDIEEFFARLISNRSIIMPYRDFYHESIFIQTLKDNGSP